MVQHSLAIIIGNNDVEGNGANILYNVRQNVNHFVQLLSVDGDAGVEHASNGSSLCDGDGGSSVEDDAMSCGVSSCDEAHNEEPGELRKATLV